MCVNRDDAGEFPPCPVPAGGPARACSAWGTRKTWAGYQRRSACAMPWPIRWPAMAPAVACLPACSRTTSACHPLFATAAPSFNARSLRRYCGVRRSPRWPLPGSGGGSDVAALRTTARRDGDDFIVDGEKTFITSGMRADFITVAVRTGDASAYLDVLGDMPGSQQPAHGARGISLLVVPGDSKGLTRTRLQKMGWHCSDTAQLRFDNVRVPARYLIGEPGDGFKMIMGNFNAERLAMSVAALGFAQACFDEALDWARQRKTFGQPLVEHQVIRHKLVDMQMRIHSTQAWVDTVSAQTDAGADRAGQRRRSGWHRSAC